MSKSSHFNGQQYWEFGVALLQCDSATLERSIALLQNASATLRRGIALLQCGSATLKRGFAVVQWNFADSAKPEPSLFD